MEYGIDERSIRVSACEGDDFKDERDCCGKAEEEVVVEEEEGFDLRVPEVERVGTGPFKALFEGLSESELVEMLLWLE